MKRIWAPWRLKYVAKADNTKNSSCLFCDKYNSTDDKENYVIYKGKYSFALLNIYPYNNGHLMVAPKRHIADISALDSDERVEFFDLIIKMKDIVSSILNPQGFNIGMNCGSAAGAGIADHIHMHIVPRWAGDTNFMTTVNATRVIPQSLDEFYEILKEKM